MEPMKNLCGLIPESLHKRLMEGKSPEMTNGEYLTRGRPVPRWKRTIRVPAGKERHPQQAQT